jgi:hypothetical protein
VIIKSFVRARQAARTQRWGETYRDGNPNLPSSARRATVTLTRIGVCLLLGCALDVPESAGARPLCESCQVQVGLGETYHYWATTGSVILPISVSWGDNRYEFGAFRFLSQQFLPWPGTRNARQMANPYWGTSLSRRWHLFELGPFQGYVGFGFSLKTDADALSVTKWDFASQAGVRFRLPGSSMIGEVTMRHWSNAGIRLPNHGQDFATLTVLLDPRLVRFAETEKISIDPSIDLNRTLAEYHARKDEALLP